MSVFLWIVLSLVGIVAYYLIGLGLVALWARFTTYVEEVEDEFGPPAMMVLFWWAFAVVFVGWAIYKWQKKHRKIALFSPETLVEKIDDRKVKD